MNGGDNEHRRSEASNSGGAVGIHHCETTQMGGEDGYNGGNGNGMGISLDDG